MAKAQEIVSIVTRELISRYGDDVHGAIVCNKKKKKMKKIIPLVVSLSTSWSYGWIHADSCKCTIVYTNSYTIFIAHRPSSRAEHCEIYGLNVFDTKILKILKQEKWIVFVGLCVCSTAPTICILIPLHARNAIMSFMMQSMFNELWMAYSFIPFVRRNNDAAVTATAAAGTTASRDVIILFPWIVWEMANNSHACIYHEVYVCLTKLALTLRQRGKNIR